MNENNIDVGDNVDDVTFKHSFFLYSIIKQNGSNYFDSSEFH